jgi:hypothetical protein
VGDGAPEQQRRARRQTSCGRSSSSTRNRSVPAVSHVFSSFELSGLCAERNIYRERGGAKWFCRDSESENPGRGGGFNVWIRTNRDPSGYRFDRLDRTINIVRIIRTTAFHRPRSGRVRAAIDNHSSFPEVITARARPRLRAPRAGLSGLTRPPHPARLSHHICATELDAASLIVCRQRARIALA